jgi:hypothetical protein
LHLVAKSDQYPTQEKSDQAKSDQYPAQAKSDQDPAQVKLDQAKSDQAKSDQSILRFLSKFLLSPQEHY